MASILVIDDEPELLASVSDALTRAGHGVLVASNPRQGLQLHRQHHPDVVITDVFMPDIGGLVVLLELARPGAARIIAMSGGGARGLVDVLEDAQAFGACCTLQKPFTRTQLLGAVDTALAAGASGTPACA
jgi:DNA-binding NtrC family response regulator